MTAAEPGWVQLTEGIRFSHAWLAAHTPDLYAAWARADGPRHRRSAASAILQAASDLESDDDPDELADPVLAVWTDLADRLDPRLTVGADWLPLAAALSRAEAAGFDVVARLPALVAARPLPARHPARELHFRLLDDCPPAAAPAELPVPSGPAPAGQHTLSEGARPMSGETTTTVIGHLTDDPEFRHTPARDVATFTVASTPRLLDKATGDWRDGDTLFLRCTVWRTPAEHAAVSLYRGARVIVAGRLRQRTFQTSAGETRTVIELDADEVGASLRFCSAKIKKLTNAASNGAAPST